MNMSFARHARAKGPTPQTERIVDREDQVKNQAGGYIFQIDDWNRLDRFLILGSEGNTYYATEQEMTVENAECALRCIKEDGVRVVDRVVEISRTARAPKNDPALFVLALCCAAEDVHTRQVALRSLPQVARTGTHLFHFAEFVNGQRGWGRALRRAVGNWYNEKPIDKLIYQVAKYQSRDGWSNRDLLRLSHPETAHAMRKGVYDWACGRKDAEDVPLFLRAVDRLLANPGAEEAVKIIRENDMPFECVPKELLGDPDIWAALLGHMNLGTLVRSLNKMTAVGLIKPFAPETGAVVGLLESAERIKDSRLHPVNLLLALKVYSAGVGLAQRGGKGAMTWTPVQPIVEALDGAFYQAFHNVQPTGKRIMLCLDVSASMKERLNNTPLEVCEAGAAIAMAIARTEANYHIMAFDNRIRELNITAKTSLKDVLKQTRGINGGGTDCALPMIYANEQGWECDAFVVITDNETHSGYMHPVQALNAYRKNTGIPAKLVVCGMTATKFSIADPKDAGMLDVVGFDAALPQLIADFIGA